ARHAAAALGGAAGVFPTPRREPGGGRQKRVGGVAPAYGKGHRLSGRREKRVGGVAPTYGQSRGTLGRTPRLKPRPWNRPRQRDRLFEREPVPVQHRREAFAVRLQ